MPRPSAPRSERRKNEHTRRGVTLAAAHRSPQQRRHRKDTQRAAVHGHLEERAKGYETCYARREKRRAGRPCVAEQALVASGRSKAVSCCPENSGRRDNKHAGCVAKPGLDPISREIGRPRGCRKPYCTHPENCAEH